jgi:hypothetical protein
VLTYQNKTDRLVSWICRLLKINREYYHDAMNYNPGDYSLGKWKNVRKNKEMFRRERV